MQQSSASTIDSRVKPTRALFQPLQVTQVEAQELLQAQAFIPNE